MSQVAASNFPAGSDSPANLDDVQRAQASFIALLRDGKGFSGPVTLASAATTDIGGQNSPFVEISGTTGITSLGTNYNGPRFLRFTGALLLTHSSSMSLTGAANITTAAGDTALAIPNLALSGWNVIFQRVSGYAASGANGDITSLTALTAGGLPDNSVLTADIANAQITAPKLSGAQTGGAPVFGVRAWATFDGTLGSPTLIDGGNVASVSKLGTGQYRITFTTALPSANYCVSGAAQCTVGTLGAVHVTTSSGTVPSTASFDIYITSGWAQGSVASALTDSPRVSVQVVG